MPQLAYETPIGTFTTIEIAEQKLAVCDLDIHMIKCVVIN